MLWVRLYSLYYAGLQLACYNIRVTFFKKKLYRSTTSCHSATEISVRIIIFPITFFPYFNSRRKCIFSPYILTFFHFGPYIFISPLLVPKPINMWHLSPCRKLTNRKSIRGWWKNKIRLFFTRGMPHFDTWISRPKPSHVYVTQGPHQPIWCVDTENPKIRLESLKLPSLSLSNHQPLSQITIINHLCHLKPPSSSTISQDLQPLQSPWSDGSKLFN